MTDPTAKSPDGWDETVGDAVGKIAEHEANVEAVKEMQRPRSRGPLLAAGIIALAVVVAWDVWYFTRPPEGLPVELVADDLRPSIQFVVEIVEDFRADNGRLPTAGEIQDHLSEEITYAVDGDQFTVSASDGVVTVTYHSSVPLDQWVGGSR